jgi:hypothetical protein
MVAAVGSMWYGATTLESGCEGKTIGSWPAMGDVAICEASLGHAICILSKSAGTCGIFAIEMDCVVLEV